MEHSKDKYILLRDFEEATSPETSSLWGVFASYVYSAPQSDPLALKGELLEIVAALASDSEETPSNNNKLVLRGIKQKELRVECLAEDLKTISTEEAQVLLGVQSLAERCRIVDEKVLQVQESWTAGTEVCVKLKDIGKEVDAVVRYRGPLLPYDGIMFGVEIQDPHFRHQGTTDGVFRCQRYFKCPTGAGLFVSLDKLSCRKNSKLSNTSSENPKAEQETLGIGDLSDDVTDTNLHISCEYEPASVEKELSEDTNCLTLDSVEELGHEHLDESKEALENTEDLNQLKISYRIQNKLLMSSKEQLKGLEQKVFEIEKQLKIEEATRSKIEAENVSLTKALKDELNARKQTEQRLDETQKSMRQQRKAFNREWEEFERRLLEEHAVRAEMEKQLNCTRQELEEERKAKAVLQNQLEQAQETSEQQDYVRDQSDTELGPGGKSHDWLLSRDEVRVTEKNLGTGGWGIVKEGTFRGCQVAVKQIHELIISPHNRRLFEREMSIASRCRHPCLLQFIGATNDDGAPFFVTELLDTNLRTVLEQRALDSREILTIALDVARALNYLHLNRPLPIIHRDISSVNVLLWKRDSCWRAKVSDYGAANFMRQCKTINPGAIIYSAPEALSAEQSTKIDVYSFGLLLCEMCIRELPVPQQTQQQISMVTDHVFRSIIQGCVRHVPTERPTMDDVLKELETMGIAQNGLSRVLLPK